MDITLHTTDELIGEIKRRHPEGTIVAVQNEPHEIRSSGNDWRVSMIGNLHVTLKLANVCLWHHQTRIMGAIKNEESEEYDGDNEA